MSAGPQRRSACLPWSTCVRDHANRSATWNARRHIHRDGPPRDRATPLNLVSIQVVTETLLSWRPCRLGTLGHFRNGEHKTSKTAKPRLEVLRYDEIINCAKFVSLKILRLTPAREQKTDWPVFCR